MATYRIKRKTFGLIDSAGGAVKNTVGGVMEGVGKAAATGTGSTIGGLAGMKAGFGIGGVGGAIAGYILGKAATKGIGKGLQNAGQDLQS